MRAILWLVRMTPLIPLFALGGCSTNKPDDLGTQIGYVSKIYPVGIVPFDYPDCLLSLTDAEQAKGRYVEIKFKNYRLVRYVNSFVPQTMSLRLDDKVEVSHPYCVGSHKPEAMRITK